MTLLDTAPLDTAQLETAQLDTAQLDRRNPPRWNSCLIRRTFGSMPWAATATSSLASDQPGPS